VCDDYNVFGSIYRPQLNPYHGNSFIGLIIFVTKPNIGNVLYYRENVYCKLLETLNPQKSYCISFQTAIAGSKVSPLATSIFQVHFSTDSIPPLIWVPVGAPSGFPGYLYFDFNSKIEMTIKTNYITDSLHWTNVKSIYQPKEEFQYMYIANFQDDFRYMDTLQVSSVLYGGAYYYFDNFELYELSDIKKAELDYLPCDGSHVPIWASGAEQYLWLDVNHNFISTDSLITIQGEALYYLVTTQCNSVDTIVFDLKYKHLQAQPPPFLPCDGSGVWLQAGGSDNFKWYDGKYNNFISDSSALLVTLPGTYYVVSDVCGQSDTVRMEVLLQNCDTLPPPEAVKPPEIPNIITPGGNGLNDFLVIKNLQPGSSLSIYNRWGNVLFESKDYQQNWDCNRCSDGTYFYVLITPDGKQYKGTLAVVGEK